MQPTDAIEDLKLDVLSMPSSSRLKKSIAASKRHSVPQNNANNQASEELKSKVSQMMSNHSQLVDELKASKKRAGSRVSSKHSSVMKASADSYAYEVVDGYKRRKPSAGNKRKKSV